MSQNELIDLLKDLPIQSSLLSSKEPSRTEQLVRGMPPSTSLYLTTIADPKPKQVINISTQTPFVKYLQERMENQVDTIEMIKKDDIKKRKLDDSH
ncbi:hypothetical protein BATDEDRAFT_85625 [Batrachochytrium dendrobatidis JAM81]|uniref:DET1- and DDB1-associated protein 1 domain-containing protein n=1 Tax=Batrachochytrium dendrobatidis (strain JAM81 / FGSC 10211) TaxID=684364 RepID=F4NRL8_BATDJ|nr:uncharacterized protein BATDEDRAFT_85625 [Batrachochytrium dendrobatidis JAM81]EGF83752.1 hypothetical protein BATDEDRAFT_85625 [Batrachochytrium dendrobatidis JAM81]|eukprot:XP_006676211.1 hypothetical protein BATDEDRAFT_85625 [Batrachochytrium dendrobatidis JAM81]